MNSMSEPSEHFAVRRFNKFAAAEKYSSALIGTAMDRREQRCIARGLASVPRGASVLDIPCGTGRLLPLLSELGYNITAADSSPHMVDYAHGFAETHGLSMSDENFVVADIFTTGFEDDAFGAVVCNRLFHHFSEPSTRRRALRELRRICTGPIVASFFCNLAYDALMSKLKHILIRTRATDRIAISFETFAKDIRAVGLVVRARMCVRPLISRQWYVVLERSDEPGEATR